MKLKNAVIGTKVKVKSGNYKGLTGEIVEFSYNDRPLVQFDKPTELWTHDGAATNKSGKSFPNSYYFEPQDIKRIKE